MFALSTTPERPARRVRRPAHGLPWLAWPLTIGMLGLAGIPGTVGFIGKFQLIHALVNGQYAWLAIVLVIGSMISLGYYLRVIATMWMTPQKTAPRPRVATLPEGLGPRSQAVRRKLTRWAVPRRQDSPAGSASGEDEGSSTKRPVYTEVVAVALVFAAACIVFGIVPSPLFHLASHAGAALTVVF